jgi:integrase/recombinase XerD
MNNGSQSFSQLLQGFFCQRLQSQQGVSGNTLASYRDTFRLGVQFIGRQTGREASRQRLEDWDQKNVLSFLDYLEKERHCQTRTRNARLAVIRAFMRYVAQQEPAALNLSHRVLAIPTIGLSLPGRTGGYFECH